MGRPHRSAGRAGHRDDRRRSGTTLTAGRPPLSPPRRVSAAFP